MLWPERGTTCRDRRLRPRPKVRRRLIPFLFLLYIVSYLDRINVGLRRAPDERRARPVRVGLRLRRRHLLPRATRSSRCPSNVILARVGARLWIARIMITWGIVSAGMMFARGPTSFYVLRFLLGAAEAGFFPGIIFYLTRVVSVARARAHDCGVHDGDARRRHRRRTDLRRAALDARRRRPRRLAVAVSSRRTARRSCSASSCCST